MKRACLFVSLLFLYGCWDVNEPERLLYIFALGIDYKNDEYVIYAQIIDFRNIAKSEQPPSPDAIQAEVGSASGETPSEAFYNLYVALDEELFWGHFSHVVFTENALKNEHANLFINTFIRFHETRYNTWVYATNEEVKEVLLTTPIINKAISLSKLADPLNSYAQDSAIEPLNFRRLIISLNEPSHEAKIPLVKLYKKWESKQGEEESYKIDSVAVLAPNTYKGLIEGADAAGLQWMNDSSKRSGLTAKANDGSNISIIIENMQPSIQMRYSDAAPVFDVTISASATISGFHGKTSNQEIKAIVAKKIEEDVRQTFERGIEIDADVYRFSEHVYRKNLDVWRKLEENGKIPLTASSLGKINVEIQKVAAGRKQFTETIK